MQLIMASGSLRRLLRHKQAHRCVSWKTHTLRTCLPIAFATHFSAAQSTPETRNAPGGQDSVVRRLSFSNAVQVRSTRISHKRWLETLTHDWLFQPIHVYLAAPSPPSPPDSKCTCMDQTGTTLLTLVLPCHAGHTFWPPCSLPANSHGVRTTGARPPTWDCGPTAAPASGLRAPCQQSHSQGHSLRQATYLGAAIPRRPLLHMACVFLAGKARMLPGIGRSVSLRVRCRLSALPCKAAQAPAHTRALQTSMSVI